MIDSNGWTHVGYYGFSHIYAKGGKRRLVDPQTGQSTFEYRIKGEWDRTQNTFEMAEMHKEQVASKVNQ